MTTPYYADATVTIHHGDCLDVLRELPDASVDAVVTDPPYSLSFMGRHWDAHENPATFQSWCLAWATECLRVLKPGGHMLAFGGTRTSHRLACAVEDAGFEIRDSIAWLYGSGFPKSMDVSKAIDKRRDDTTEVEVIRHYLETARVATGASRREIAEAFRVNSRLVQKWMGVTPDPQAHLPTWQQWVRLKQILNLSDQFDGEVRRLNERKGTLGEAWESREVIGMHAQSDPRLQSWAEMQGNERGTAKEIRGAPATDAARTWQGWGTALKPAHEPVVVARKPLAGTVAANVLAHGTGALNVDGCRVGMSDEDRAVVDKRSGVGFGTGDTVGANQGRAEGRFTSAPAGRWPANVVLDEAQAAALDAQSGERPGFAGGGATPGDVENDVYGKGWQRNPEPTTYGDTGGASRFFYTAREDQSCPNHEPANTAETTSSPPSEADDSAPGDAATSASPDTARPTPSAFTSARESASRPSDASDTRATPTTAGASSPESPHARATPTPSPASSAGPSLPIDTTTTTASPSTSDGSADLTTSSTTPPLLVPGGLDSLDARFRYTAKAPTDERPRINGVAHPTTKPLALMRWLVRLVTPPGGTVLEPFAGSGTTVEACILEGFRCIAIEREADYLPLIRQRIHRRRDPVEAVRGSGEDAGLFDLLDGGVA